MSELQRLHWQYQTQLNGVAEAMRKCAEVADQYAAALAANGKSLPPDFAQSLNGAALPAPKRRRRKADAEGDDAPKKRRKRAPREEGAPKRPPSAYLLYQNAVRASMKEQHPDKTHSEMLKIVAESWKHLPTEQKNHYMSQVQEQKSQYEADMSKFKEAKGANLVAAEVEAAEDVEDASEVSDAESSDAAADADPTPVSEVNEQDAAQVSAEADSDSSEEVDEAEDAEGDSSSEEEQPQPVVSKKGKGSVSKPPSSKGGRKTRG